MDKPIWPEEQKAKAIIKGLEHKLKHSTNPDVIKKLSIGIKYMKLGYYVCKGQYPK